MADYGRGDGREGQQLGNYRLIRLLGRGGFAEVYLGEHIYLETQAAIKVLYTQLASEDVEQFRQEARTIARLIHPHIVRVLEYGVQGTTPFLVMDYAPNGTLRQRHPSGTCLPLSTVVDYIKQIAPPLQYAHEQKLIHRDMKPENLLVGRSNEILLSDFGIALVAHSSNSQSTQDMAGTVAYMAPEQIEARPRPSSDQYALGIIVYEWLCGDRPFHGSFTEIAIKHSLVPPPSLCEKLPNLSPMVEQVVMTALTKDPKRRFASVRAFATALEQASQVAGSTASRILYSPTPYPNDAMTEPYSSQELRTLPDKSSMSTPLSTPPNQVGDHLQLDCATPQVFADRPQSALEGGTLPEYEQNGIELERAGDANPQKVSEKGSISRRAAVVGLVGIGVVAVAGGVAVLANTQYLPLTSPASMPPTTAPTPTVPPPNPAINSSGTMFGFDLRHTHFDPHGHILSPANVSRLVPYWTVTTGDVVYSSPTVANGIVYVGSNDHKLYAINAATGQILWTASTSSFVGSSPTVANGVVYIGSNDGGLYAFDASTGQILWTLTTGNSIRSSPAVASGVVYIGSFDHMLYAVNASMGQTLWTVGTGSAITSSPAVANGIVYIGSHDHQLYAVNASTGKILWTVGTGDLIHSSPAVANGIVYIGSNDRNLYAVNASTGKILWAVTTGGLLRSSPAIANGVVYIGSNDHKLYAFDAHTGQTLWTTTTADLIESSPAVGNGVVYIGSNDRNLYAFDAHTGQTLWTTTAGDHVESSPMVADGMVYVGSFDHMLYAFHLS